MSKIKISKDVLRIKDLIGRSRKVKLRDSKDEVITQLKEMGHRIEKIEKKFKKKSISTKRKKQIIFLLKNKEMTSAEVGKALKFSRSRANEYLKAMEDDGILEGVLRGKKRYYKIKRIEK